MTIDLNQCPEQAGKPANGRYQLEVFSHESLGDQLKAVEVVKNGDLDVAEFHSDALSAVVPGIKVMNLPFL